MPPQPGINLRRQGDRFHLHSIPFVAVFPRPIELVLAKGYCRVGAVQRSTHINDFHQNFSLTYPGLRLMAGIVGAALIPL